MSNNDLPCSKCKGQHHPADDCMKDDSREALIRSELSEMHTAGNTDLLDMDTAVNYVLSREAELRNEYGKQRDEQCEHEQCDIMVDLRKDLRECQSERQMWQTRAQLLEAKIHRIVEPLKDHTQLPIVRITNAIAESEK